MRFFDDGLHGEGCSYITDILEVKDEVHLVTRFKGHLQAMADQMIAGCGEI